MITVNDMYKESSSKDTMLLSSYTSEFWSDYRTNYKHYDKLFRRMFKSFKYFLQEDDETISDITTNFTDDVYNHLLINNKRYSELYRIHVIDDNNYSLTDNYNITETMNKDSSNNSTNTYGARTDTTDETEGERTDTNNVVLGSRTDNTNTQYGEQNNSTTSKVAPYDSETFANNNKTDELVGSKTDVVNFSKGEETDNNTTTKGVQINNASFIKGSQVDSINSSSNEGYKLTRKGNIGIQTVTDILDKHKRFWTKWDFYNFVFMEISKELLIV